MMHLHVYVGANKLLCMISEDMRMVFREGRTKAVGSVTKLYPHTPMSEEQGRYSRHVFKKSLQEGGQAAG